MLICATLTEFLSVSRLFVSLYSSSLSIFVILFCCSLAHHQEKIRGQRGRLQVQALGYVNSTKVFRDVRIKANLDLMF